MKKMDFAQLLGDIDERYIAQAETAKKVVRPVWVKWGAMAACACLAAVLLVHFPAVETPGIPGTTEPPTGGTGNYPNSVSSGLPSETEPGYVESRILIVFADMAGHRDDLEEYFKAHGIEIVYTYETLGGFAVDLPDELDLDGVIRELSGFEYVYSVQRDSASVGISGTNSIH